MPGLWRDGGRTLRRGRGNDPHHRRVLLLRLRLPGSDVAADDKVEEEVGLQMYGPRKLEAIM